MTSPNFAHPILRDLSPQLEELLQTGLQLLYRAYRCSTMVETSIWDFALEASELRGAGLTISEFRWLLMEGYIEHAQEITSPNQRKRTFAPLGPQMFPEKTCFVLTQSGVELARSVMGGNSLSIPRRPDAAFADETPFGSSPTQGRRTTTFAKMKPRWDAERRELRIGELLLKLFRWPAKNQETILAVFEEEEWPSRIDDPLPVVPEQDPKRRLHDTIKCLNQKHRAHIIRFRGDGTGEGVIWGLIESPTVHGEG